MTSSKSHSRRKISSYLHLFKKEQDFANFLDRKGIKGFLADYLLFFLVTILSILTSGVSWYLSNAYLKKRVKFLVYFFKYLTVIIIALKSSQLLTVLFGQSFQFMWGNLHRYTQYVLYLMAPIIFVVFSIVGMIICVLIDEHIAKTVTSYSLSPLTTDEKFKIFMSKLFLVLLFTSLLLLLEKVFIFFAINMYQQENDEKRLNNSTFRVIETLREKYFGKHDSISKESLCSLEDGPEIAQDIAEAIYSNVKAHSPRGADSKGLKAEDFAHVLTREEISNLFRGIDFDNSGDISKSELSQAIQLLYQEQKDLIKSNEDASSIINRTEDILKGAIFYCVFLFASIIFDFQVPVTVISLIGGAIIGWLAMDETLKEILNTFTFLFFVHPFDIGDKIVFKGEKYVIRGIHFLHSEMITSGNTTAYIKNSAFCGEKILNFKRSDFQIETVTLNIHPDSINEERLKELNKKLNLFLEANNEDFMPSGSLGKLNYESSSSVKMGVSYMHKANFCNGGMYERRCKAFNKELYHLVIQCGLKYGS